MKQTGTLVVSLRGVNFGFWSRLGFREETQSNFLLNLFCLPHCLCDYKLKSKISKNSREHYNPNNQ